MFKKFLKYADTLWAPKELSEAEEKKFLKACREFYKTKTEKRVRLYFDKASMEDKRERINGTYFSSLEDIFSRLDWDWLCSGTPVRIHGDLHFENIIVSEAGEFYLLDWRQHFGGIKEYGDIYYDFAKLFHGFIISHELINKEHFNVDEDGEEIFFDLYRKYSLLQSEKIFLDFLAKRQLDIKKVKMLTALIFLNIAPLHHFPYNKLLFYLGKTELHKLVYEGGDCA